MFFNGFKNSFDDRKAPSCGKRVGCIYFTALKRCLQDSAKASEEGMKSPHLTDDVLQPTDPMECWNTLDQQGGWRQWKKEILTLTSCSWTCRGYFWSGAAWQNNKDNLKPLQGPEPVEKGGDDADDAS